MGTSASERASSNSENLKNNDPCGCHAAIRLISVAAPEGALFCTNKGCTDIVRETLRI